MITVEERGSRVLTSDEYTIKGGFGFMGDTVELTAHVGPYWLIGKSFTGDADKLARDDSPIRVVLLQSWFSLWGIERFVGKQRYLMIQNGQTVVMYEGKGEDLRFSVRIISDRVHASS